MPSPTRCPTGRRPRSPASRRGRTCRPYAGHAAPPDVQVSVSAAARRIAAPPSSPRAQAVAGLLRAPRRRRWSSGLRQRVLDRAAERARAPLPEHGGSAAGRTTAAGDVTIDDMVAGGNLVATRVDRRHRLRRGLGTITSVCNDRVVGFGHPMDFVGKSTYGLAGADALYIQGDPLGASFKVANIGDVLGTIDQDRMTGISGPLGVDAAARCRSPRRSPTPRTAARRAAAPARPTSSSRRGRRDGVLRADRQPPGGPRRLPARARRSSRGRSTATPPTGPFTLHRTTATPTPTTSPSPRRGTCPTCCGC